MTGPAQNLMAAFSGLALVPSAPSTFTTSAPLTWLVILTLMAILPFVLVIITPFAKLVIVGGLLRSALGSPQVPPNTVITGLALILTLYVMLPVITAIKANFDADAAIVQPAVASASSGDAKGEASEILARRIAMRNLRPLYDFMLANTLPGNLELFDEMTTVLRERATGRNGGAPVPSKSPATAERIASDLQMMSERHESWTDLTSVLAILAPAFILTELTEALQMAFFVFVPFVVIDLFVTNILLALGMQQMTPTTISLPLKLLVFVLMDGWRLVIQGILFGYHYQLADAIALAAGGAS